MCMLVMPIIHVVHKFVIKFWLHVQLMGHGVLLLDKYSPRNIHIGEEDSSYTLIAV
jgi:hypothetical protein